ncbi:hypothetical protein ABIA96_007010 [Bradyrhizobium sp. LB11.1]
MRGRGASPAPSADFSTTGHTDKKCTKLPTSRPRFLTNIAWYPDVARHFLDFALRCLGPKIAEGACLFGRRVPMDALVRPDVHCNAGEALPLAPERRQPYRRSIIRGFAWLRRSPLIISDHFSPRRFSESRRCYRQPRPGHDHNLFRRLKEADMCGVIGAPSTKLSIGFLSAGHHSLSSGGERSVQDGFLGLVSLPLRNDIFVFRWLEVRTSGYETRLHPGVNFSCRKESSRTQVAFPPLLEGD